MSTEEAEASRGAAVAHRHTWEEGDPHGSQGRPRLGDEDEAERGEEEEDEEEEEGEGCREGRGCGDACGGAAEYLDGEDSGGNISTEDGAVGGTSSKTQAMHSNCSSETCIPTPSCRICFQGAEQVNAPPTRR